MDWIVLNQVVLGLLSIHLFKALYYLFKVSALMRRVTTFIRVMLEVLVFLILIVDLLVVGQMVLWLHSIHLFIALYLFKVSALMRMVTTQLKMMLEVLMVATWIQVMMGKILQFLLLVMGEMGVVMMGEILQFPLLFFLILIESVVQLVCAEDVLALIVAGNQ